MYCSYEIILIVIVSTCAIGDAFNSRKCKFNRKCSCYLPLYRANCTSRHLYTIPNLPNTIMVAELSGNFIRSIPPYHFQNNTHLTELNLANNILEYIEKDTFYGLFQVLKLNIENNKIGLVHGDTFLFLQSLQELDIKHNFIRTTDLNFTALISLRTLRMDLIANEKESLPNGLKNVKILDVSGTSGHCNVKVLTPNTFSFLPNLEDINLSACKINRVHRGTFRSMTNLRILDVSFNPCLKFSGAENITYDLPYTKIKTVKLNKIHKTFEMNTKILLSHLKNLKFTNISEIQIDSNRIQQVEKGALKMLPPTIRTISMSDNEFSYGEYLNEIVTLPLEIVNISYLFKSHMPTEEETCEHAYSPIFFNYSDDETSVLGSKFLFSNVIIVPYKLKTFVYRECQIRYEIPPMNLSENTAEYLDGTGNLFYSWVGPLLYLNNVWYLDLSSNMCSYVSKVFFQSTPNLKVLRARNNLLGFVLPDDKHGEILQHVPRLEEINFSENRIPSLPSLFFHAQISLKELYLSGNMLDDVIFQIDHMKNLSHLDLSNNRLSSLDKPALSQLDTVFRLNENFSLDISENPLKCTCDTVQFIHWMVSTHVRLIKLHSYTCKLADGTKQTFKNPVRVYESLEKNCSSYTSVTISVTILIILFVFILVAGLSFRHRWKLRYMYYMVKIKYQSKNRKKMFKDDNIYKYDAFISYEDNNQEFVHSKLLKKLEVEGGLKLCIHKRDFIPGNDIAGNITSAIHDSRKVVVMMSQNYLESYWCMFEYNMARVESIYSRSKENILFLVFLEQISTRDLPLVVLELVQTQSYIEYPNDEYGEAVFWDKLLQVLSCD